MGGAARDYVQFELLGYIERRPQACDTIDGIINWWLYDQRQTIGRATVLEAVSGLVREGALEEQRGPGGEILYAAPRPRQPPMQRQE
ncbi:MAG: hypothetical protein JO238_07495 [Alphaproteobacteria bacterium]|nr:hypothetical protein [Alphaproteobacteria bacterium]